MKNLQKPVFASTVLIASLAFTSLAFAHGTSRHNSMEGQSMMSGQGHMMNQGQMGQLRTMTTSRMQHRRDHRVNNRAMGSHQRMKNYNPMKNDPDLKAAFADD